MAKYKTIKENKTTGLMKLYIFKNFFSYYLYSSQIEEHVILSHFSLAFYQLTKID